MAVITTSQQLEQHLDDLAVIITLLLEFNTRSPGASQIPSRHDGPVWVPTLVNAKRFFITFRSKYCGVIVKAL